MTGLRGIAHLNSHLEYGELPTFIDDGQPPISFSPFPLAFPKISRMWYQASWLPFILLSLSGARLDQILVNAYQETKHSENTYCVGSKLFACIEDIPASHPANLRYM